MQSEEDTIPAHPPGLHPTCDTIQKSISNTYKYKEGV